MVLNLISTSATPFVWVLGTLRVAGESRFNVFSFGASCTRGLSSFFRLQQRQYDPDEEEAYHLRLHPVLVCELDMRFCVPIWQKLHVSSTNRSLTRFWLVRKTRQIQHHVSHCGIFN